MTVVWNQIRVLMVIFMLGSRGVPAFRRSDFAFTLPLNECLTHLDLDCAASGISDGGDETNSKQEPSIVYRFMQSNLLLGT